MEESLINIETVKAQAMEFLCSTQFLMATGLFFLYLFITGFLRRVFGFFGAIIGALFGIFSPLALRRVFFNTISLVFMVAAFAMYGGGSAKLEGKEGVWEAVVSGSLALGLWSVLMLVAHLVRENRRPPVTRQYSVGRSSKVKPPSSFEQ